LENDSDHQSAIAVLQGRRYRAWLDEVRVLEDGVNRQISPQSQYCEAVDIVLADFMFNFQS
jgi:hypothetical protein